MRSLLWCMPQIFCFKAERSNLLVLFFFFKKKTEKYCINNWLSSYKIVWNMCWTICLQNRLIFVPDYTQNQVQWRDMTMLWHSTYCPCLQLIGTSTDLCEDIKKKRIGRKNRLNIQLHVRELDYILVIFCMRCLFHRMHVCQMTRCSKRNNLLWPLVVKSVVLLTRVMSERKYLKEIIVSMLISTDISYSTRVNLIYELPMHRAISSDGCLQLM